MASAYDIIQKDKLRAPGDLYWPEVLLVSYVNGPSNAPKRYEIKSLIANIAIYEDLYTKTLQGEVALVDGQNLPVNLPLTGTERLEFKFETPGMTRGYDFTAETGSPMYIYKITNRSAANDTAQSYVLHFCSREKIVNEQKRVCKAFTGTVDYNIISLLRDRQGLNTKKRFFFEEAKDVQKFTIPNLHPFDAIDLMGRNARSLRFNNGGFLFYETSQGFHFRTLESLYALMQDAARPVIGRFTVNDPKNKDVTSGKDMIKEMQKVIDMNVVEQFDTLKNLNRGSYASRLIEYDSIRKSYAENDYDYHSEFANYHHTEHDGTGNRKADGFSVPFTPYANEGENKLSDNYNGRILLTAKTTGVHNDYEQVSKTTYLQHMISERTLLNTQRLELDMYGNTQVSVGDMVAVSVPNIEPVQKIAKKGQKDFDPYLTGRYLITCVKHTWDNTSKKHLMKLEVCKDSQNYAYPIEFQNTFEHREYDNSIRNISQYTLDDKIINSGLDDGV